MSSESLSKMNKRILTQILAIYSDIMKSMQKVDLDKFADTT